MVAAMKNHGILLQGWCNHTIKQALWTTAWQFLERSSRELPYGPAIPLLGV